MTDREAGRFQPEPEDPDQDRYPTAAEGLRRIAEEGDLGDFQVESITVRWQANGEGTWKVMPARADEPEVGFIPAPS